MNWQDPAAVAAYIGVGATGFLALILKARGFWVREKRDTTYDTEQTKWVEGLQSEIRQLRIDKDNLFAQRLLDVTKIAQQDAMIDFMTKEVERMRKTMEAMGAGMASMKRRLALFDKTVTETTPAPLE